MGKSLRGKECGKGICQRKDGLYSARFVTKTGKRQVKHEIGWTMPSMQISTKYICSARYDGRRVV